jgi:uncharacterized protein (DUF2252 family)
MRLARYLATVVGKAHARQLDEATRNAVARRAQRPPLQRRSTLPSWLWASVVDLLATHEKAYLEHCRRYATETSRA